MKLSGLSFRGSPWMPWVHWAERAAAGQWVTCTVDEYRSYARTTLILRCEHDLWQTYVHIGHRSALRRLRNDVNTLLRLDAGCSWPNRPRWKYLDHALGRLARYGVSFFDTQANSSQGVFDAGQ